MTHEGVYSLAQIPLSSVRRLPTGFRYLDLAYGLSTFADRRGRPAAREAGLPCGALSLWAGEPGVGKSRLCIAVAAKMNTAGYRVLYFQNESTLNEFRQWTATQVANPRSFLVSNLTSLEGQLQAIRRHKPHLVILDSLNMVEGIQSAAVLRHAMQSYKEAVARIGGHAILIAHLNKEGSVKGSNDIEYLVDVQCALRRLAGQLTPQQMQAMEAAGANYKSMFYLTFEKNRFGPTVSGGCTMHAAFEHTAYGIEYVSSSLDSPFHREDEEL